MHRVQHSWVARTFLALVLTSALSSIAAAQKPFTMGVGGGAAIGSRGASSDGSYAHGLAFLEIKAPVFPVGIRGDAMVTKNGSSSNGAFSVGASAVYSLPIPVVTPYATGGWGIYGLGSASRLSGWSLGAGVRIKVPTTAGLFAEVHRHQRFQRDVVTVGIAF